MCKSGTTVVSVRKHLWKVLYKVSSKQNDRWVTPAHTNEPLVFIEMPAPRQKIERSWGFRRIDIDVFRFCDFLNIWSCSDSVGDFVFHFYLIHLSTFKKYMYYDYYYWFPFVISQNPAQTRCTRDNIMWSSLSAAGRWFSPGFPVSSTNRIDRHYITEILLKVVLNTIIITV